MRYIERIISSTLASCAALFFAVSCGGSGDSPDPEPEPEPAEIPEIKLTSPEDGASITLSSDTGISFSWEKAEGISNYKIRYSLKEDFSDAKVIPALKNPLAYTGKEFDQTLADMGVEAGTEATIFWSVIPFSSKTEAKSETRRLTVTRIPKAVITPGENADTITVKVACLIEDMVVSSTGKSLHESCNWNNPRTQMQELAKNMTEASHGVCQYKIVKIVEADSSYAYNVKTGKRITADYVYEDCWKKNQYPGLNDGIEYDYSGMVQDFGFDTLRNNDEITEVWVYNHPAAGMYETIMGGPGAFWINGGPFTCNTLNKKLTVLFCNYERTTDLAMHSLAHKMENVMKKVYGRWSYDVAKEEDLNNWERFSGYELRYGKYEDGCAHIGNCHFPCNGTSDYDYSNRSYVKSYCDDWLTYPVMPHEKTRTINSSEWNSTQMGYMKWFWSHVPHFKGINPDEKDLKLNNWWYYFIDYDAAVAYEKQLRLQM